MKRASLIAVLIACVAGVAAAQDVTVTFDMDGARYWKQDPGTGLATLVLTDAVHGVVLEIDRGGAPFGIQSVTAPGSTWGKALSPFPDTSESPFRIRITSLGDLAADPGLYGMGWGVKRFQWDMGDAVPSDSDGYYATVTATRTEGQSYSRDFSKELAPLQDEMEPGFVSTTKHVEMIYPITEVLVRAGSGVGLENSVYYDNFALTVVPRDPGLFSDPNATVPAFYPSQFLPDTAFGKTAASDAPTSDFGGGNDELISSEGGAGGPDGFEEDVRFDLSGPRYWTVDGFPGLPTLVLTDPATGVELRIDRGGAPFSLEDLGARVPRFGTALSPFCDPAGGPFRIRVTALGVYSGPGPYGLGWGVQTIQWEMGDFVPSDTDAWYAEVTAARQPGESYARQFSNLVTPTDQSLLAPGFCGGTRYVRMMYPVTELLLTAGAGPGDNSAYFDNFVVRMAPRDPNLFGDPTADRPSFYSPQFLPDMACGKTAASDAPATDFGGGNDDIVSSAGGVGDAGGDVQVSFGLDGPRTWEVDPETGVSTLILVDPDTNVEIRIDRYGTPLDVLDLGPIAPEFGRALSPFGDTGVTPLRVRVTSLGNLAADPGLYGMGWGVKRIEWQMGDFVPSDQDAYYATVQAARNGSQSYTRDFSGMLGSEDQTTLPPGFHVTTKYVEMIYPITSLLVRAGTSDLTHHQENSVFYDNFVLTLSSRNPGLLSDPAADRPSFYSPQFLPDPEYGKTAASDAPATDFGGGNDDLANVAGGDGLPEVVATPFSLDYGFVEAGTPRVGSLRLTNLSGGVIASFGANAAISEYDITAAWLDGTPLSIDTGGHIGPLDFPAGSVVDLRVTHLLRKPLNFPRSGPWEGTVHAGTYSVLGGQTYFRSIWRCPLIARTPDAGQPDVRNDADPYLPAGMVVAPPAGSIRQGFVPRAAALSAVELRLSSFRVTTNDPDTYPATVRIRDANGSLLGTSATVQVSPSLQSQLLWFRFDPPAGLAPGDLHFIEYEILDREGGVPVPMYRDDDPYAGGTCTDWLGVEQPDWDIYFVTFSPHGTTVVGENMFVIPAEGTTGATPVQLTFSEVTSGGQTTIAPYPGGAPAGFQVGDPPMAWNVSTTAVFAGPVEIRFHYAEAAYSDETTIRLFHWENDAWVDVTTRLDTENDDVYGVVESLSPFLVVEPNPDQPPTANAGGPYGAEATCPAGALVTLDGTGSSDPESGGLTYLWEADGIVFDDAASATPAATFPLGETEVTLTVSDGTNEATATVGVTVVDTTPPVLSGLEEHIVVECQGDAARTAATLTAPGVTDNGDPVLVVESDAADVLTLGDEVMVTWSATDSSGNTGYLYQWVMVVDGGTPSLTVPADVTVELTGERTAVDLGEATATDVCDGELTPTNDAPEEGFLLGATEVRWTATDASGKSVTRVQLVTVEDTTAPALEVPETTTVEAAGPGGTVVSIGVVASDLSGEVTVTRDPAEGHAFPLGVHGVTWTATDGSGNSTTAAGTVVVLDTIAPVLGSLTVDPLELWPPDHRLVGVTITIVASDAVDLEPGMLVTVTSSEPENGTGDGDAAPDILPAELTGAGVTFEGDQVVIRLRAERAGSGSGRIYTITVRARDEAGNLSQPMSAQVVVRHDTGNGNGPKGKAGSSAPEPPAPPPGPPVPPNGGPGPKADAVGGGDAGGDAGGADAVGGGDGKGNEPEPEAVGGGSGKDAPGAGAGDEGKKDDPAPPPAEENGSKAGLEGAGVGQKAGATEGGTKIADKKKK